MSKTVSLPVSLREKSGKGAARETRRNKLVPGVIYGAKQPPVLIAIQPQILWAELNRSGYYTRLFQLDVDGKKELCVARDVQMHPVTDKPIHVDFLRVDPKSSIVVRVPVHFENQEKNADIKSGGILNVIMHDIDIHTPAGAIPSALSVDVSALAIGESIHLSALTLPQDVTLAGHYEAEAVLASIVAPTVKLATEGEETPATEG